MEAVELNQENTGRDCVRLLQPIQKEDLKLSERIFKFKDEPRVVALGEAVTKDPDWKVALTTIDINCNCPRRFSINALCAVLGRDDPKALLKELEESNQVNVYFCNNVKSLVVAYAKAINLAITKIGDPGWKRFDEHLKEFPYPEVKGFTRQISLRSTNPIIPSKEPFDPPYYYYARKVNEALRKAGYTPGWEVPPDPPQEVTEATATANAT